MNLTCPVSISEYPRVLLAHGGGGRLMHRLINDLFLTAFGRPSPEASSDAAVIELPGKRVAFTTDSYVVRPLFFPGGDIGSLAVHGTVNDLAMRGARPRFLSCAFVLEEGLSMELLWHVVCSMRDATVRCGVQIIAGDTKVVDKGRGDGVFINTTGLGVIEHAQTIAPEHVQDGDAILVSGDVGRHGMAIMAVREGLEFEGRIESDSAPVHRIVLDLLADGIEIHCLRDLTRGGLASALNEISEGADRVLAAVEHNIPVREDVRGACEILGLDPLQVACEGRFIAFLPERQASRALSILQRHPNGASACRIGQVTDRRGKEVWLQSAIGVNRILDVPSGAQLPRIC